jgi:hypothetical protein
MWYDDDDDDDDTVQRIGLDGTSAVWMMDDG